MMLQIGDQFDHYQVMSHVAQGGMSDIYIVRDLMNSREVALKIPNAMTVNDPALLERFQRELKIMETLDHPAVQKGIASGQYNRTPYLVTEWIDGRSMRDLIEHEAPLPPERAISLIRKIADGVAYCHDHGVVHRDLKPENVLITAEGQPVILDFGLALTKEGRRVTFANVSGGASGTPDYMAPEQIEGGRGDVRTDIYALATMLYELLTGTPPYTGDNAMSVLSQHLHGDTPRLDKARPELSPQLCAIVARALQREPDERYQTVSGLIDALDHPEKTDTSILQDTAAPADQQTSPPPKPTRAIVAASVGTLIVLAMVLLVVLTQAQR
jgi:eukaryotic-like serine/threonine-protein kinase